MSAILGRSLAISFGRISLMRYSETPMGCCEALVMTARHMKYGGIHFFPNLGVNCRSNLPTGHSNQFALNLGANYFTINLEKSANIYQICRRKALCVRLLHFCLSSNIAITEPKRHENSTCRVLANVHNSPSRVAHCAPP